MAHKTLMAGTAYEISGGKTLINGTAYSIKNGKTLVDGTAYEVVKNCYISACAGFYATTNDNKWYEGDDYFDDGCAYIVIDNVKYTSGINNIPIWAGSEICVKVSSSSAEQEYNCFVKLNGQVVQDGGGWYYFTSTNDCQIKIIRYGDIDDNWRYFYYWTAEITM